jgi:hypothetical protein
MPTVTASQAAWFEDRGKLFWLALGALAAAQLVAFWLLCSHQVRKAEARHAAAQVQQLALADCLQYVPGATIASCSARMPAVVPAAAVLVSPKSGATPVSFHYR